VDLPVFEPMALTRIAAPFDHADFLYEWKADGFRCLAYISDDRCDLVSSRSSNQYKSFDSLKTALAKLKVENAILDGEIVCLDSEGRSG
jgi:bifunctional non-homologous end joining protein LigD